MFFYTYIVPFIFSHRTLIFPCICVKGSERVVFFVFRGILTHDLKGPLIFNIFHFFKKRCKIVSYYTGHKSK
jgi:hypothetical protein